MSFVHLHNHSEYSLLDGLSNVKDLVARAVELGQPAIALTDHGAMHGIIKFYVAAKKAGIKPILGMEGYLAPRTLHDKEGAIDTSPAHILLLAQNLQGYRNLMQLCTIANVEGFYYKPRIDKQVLRKYAEGIITSSGCIDGEIPRALLQGNYTRAQELVREYLDIFGPENFFFELQRHQTENPGRLFEMLEKVNLGIVKLAHEFKLPLVATNDVHYVRRDDAEAQDALLAVQTKEMLGDPNRKLSMADSPDFYLKSTDEMQMLFKEHPEALENTLMITDRITDDYELPMGKMIFPYFEVPEGMTPDSYLRKLAYDNLPNKYPNPDEVVIERIEKELKIISDKGYSSYILIMGDLADFCKGADILTNARGSAAGSVVQYLLDIVHVDPLKYKLPFERFLNPRRPTPPDVDLDIADIGRDKVIQYTAQKYGQDKVAQVCTFGTMEARAAVRDVGRVMGMPYTFCDKIAKLIPPPKQGHHTKLEDDMKLVPELQELYSSNPEVKKLLDLVMKLQGVTRHASTHAAAVIIADKPLTDYVPLMQDRKGGRLMTQYDMYSLDLNAVDDAVGLLKMDYLGLRNLSILSEAIKLVEKYHGIKIDPYTIPLDEEIVYKMLGEGDTTGVFQMESSGMRQVARDMKPNRVEDLIALVALYRPGPMDMIPTYIEGKKNPATIEYPHPALQQVLADTYGVLVYQEQCMEIAVVMAGYDLGQGDLLRRAIGKKKKELMEQEKIKFVEAAQQQGYPPHESEEVFGYIEKFASYGFNRAHAASYGLLAYQTAYMKAIYPVEYFTALMSCESHNTEKIALIVAECKRKGIPILPPDINKSSTEFTIEELPEGTRGIRYALNAIKNVGDGAVEEIVKERDHNGPFSDLWDLCRRVDSHAMNRKTLESFIYAGALNKFGPRSGILKVMPEYLEAANEHQRMIRIGQNNLFGLDPNVSSAPPVSRIPNFEEINEQQILQWEKEILGFYLTKHPHEEKLTKIGQFVSLPLNELTDQVAGRELILGGFVTAKSVVTTKKDQREMAFLSVTDSTGNIEIIVFPDVYQNGARQIEEDTILLAKGKLDVQDDGSFKMIAKQLFVPNL
ncbi:DNA polymerase III subunit alpha [candidate division WWE3 bacterium]|nr:DNA polymerase III subunit alpha [candidate division WWE3 bacterium]